LGEEQHGDAFEDGGAILVGGGADGQHEAGDARRQVKLVFGDPQRGRQGGVGRGGRERHHHRLLALAEEPQGRNLAEHPEQDRIDDEHMHAERQQDHADISAEADQQFPAEHRGEVEHEAGDGDWGEADDQADQPHRNMKQTLDRILQAARLWRVGQQQADTEDQREHHHREDVIGRHRRNDIVGNDRQHCSDALRLVGLAREDRAGPFARIGEQLVGKRRIDPSAGLEQVGHGQRNYHRQPRDEEGESERLQPDPLQ